MANLEDIPADYLRELLATVDDADAAKRLMVALTYKEIDGMSQNRAAAIYGFSSGWASRWFNRLERLADEPFEDVLSDEPRSGRPSELSDDHRTQFEAVLHEPPESVGIDAPAWTVDHARRYLSEQFAVEYSARHVRRLLKEAGLSPTTVQSETDVSGDPDRQSEEDVANDRTVWTPR